MFKKMASILLATLLINSISIQAFASESLKKNDDSPKFTEEFPNYKKSLKESTNGVKLADEETFVKITIMNNNTSEPNLKKGLDENGETVSFKSEISTKEQYLLEQNQLNSRANGDLHGDINNQNRWMRLTLQVFEGKTKNQYMAYSFFEWLTKPIYTFTDAHGINFTGMAIGNHDSIRAEYRWHDFNTHTMKVEQSPVISNHLGVASKVDIRAMNCSRTCTPMNMGMLQVPLSYLQYTPGSEHVGNVFTSYVHAQVNINPGSISLGFDGKPQIGLSLEDRFELGKAVIVKNY
ncbi:MAG: hypothetical protein ACRDA5_14085 [Clostridium sp.]